MKRFLFAAIFAFASIFNVIAGDDDVITSFAHESYLHDAELHEKARLYEVKLTTFVTYVTIEVVPTINTEKLYCWTSNETCVVSGDAILPLLGLYDKETDSYRSCTYNDKLYVPNAVAGRSYYFTFGFSGRLPQGYTEFSLVDNAKEGRGYSFKNRTINNPKKENTLTEADCKSEIDSSNDNVCGIYEEVGGDRIRIACVKTDEGNYVLVYLGCYNYKPWWFTGDGKGVLKPSATPGLFKAIWVMDNKLFDSEAYAGFDGSSIKVVLSSEEPKERTFLKMYPAATTHTPTAPGAPAPGGATPGSELSQWSGTGFALYNNYIATNYHVVKGAQTITIHGVNGDFTKSYNAVVIATDKYNDLAILRVEGVSISNASIPYSVRTVTADVGEEIFVLGYPMTSTLGDEIKLTKGIINSKTGYMGDVSLYQISASLHGGNSGGPVFDENGNVIAIAVAHLDRTTTENVNYAIKASYLRNLMESVISEDVLPKTNTISSLKLSEQTKAIKNYVYYITCSGVLQE